MEELAQVLRLVPSHDDPAVLVSSATFDDAACLRLEDGTTMVQTVDLFGPVVDDPVDYGRIAAANAVSDVYAMGGVPRFALAILAIPADLDRTIAAEILRGGAEVAGESGVAIVGGHTVTAPEPLYGLAVTGFIRAGVAPWTNAGGRVGDLLCLTKPLGSGVVANALRKDLASTEAIDAAVGIMATTNRAAADALRSLDPSAVVDVTGFGLVGHLHAMARQSGVAAEVDLGALPLIDGAYALAEQGIVPGGSKRNRSAASAYLEVTDGADATRVILACDAQTSGGLLAAVAPDVAPDVLPGTVIGRLVTGDPGAIRLA